MTQISSTLDTAVLKLYRDKILLVGSIKDDQGTAVDEYGYLKRKIQTMGAVNFIKPLPHGVLISTEDMVCFCRKDCICEGVMERLPSGGLTGDELLRAMVPRSF